MNFHQSYKIKTWATSEALLVLEKALHMYNLLEIEEQRKTNQTILKSGIEKLEHDRASYSAEIDSLKKSLKEREEESALRENQFTSDKKKLHSSITFSIILNIVFSILIITGIAFWITRPEIKDQPYADIIQWLFIPFASAILYDAIKLVKNFRDQR